MLKGGVYRIRARNFHVGAYDGDGGFIGVRRKFGAEYLFREWHDGRQVQFNSVSEVMEQVATVPEGVEVEDTSAALFDFLRPYEAAEHARWVAEFGPNEGRIK